jgi:hypothetical protein
MKKDRTKSSLPTTVFASEGASLGQQLVLPELLIGARRALRELVMQSGLAVFSALLDQDRAALCGPWGRFQEDRQAYRHGHDVGQVVLGGRKVRLRKPRIHRRCSSLRKIRTVSGLTRSRAERHWSQTCARVTQKARSA